MWPSALLAVSLPFLTSHTPTLRPALAREFARPVPVSRASTAPGFGTDDQWSSEFDLPGPGGEVVCAAEYHGDLYVGGRFGRIGGITARNIARWDGQQWHDVGDGMDQGVYCLQVYGDKLVAGGAFSHSGTASAPGLALWNGSTWDTLPGSPRMYGFPAVIGTVTTFQGELVVAGDLNEAGSAFARNIARWDGSQWSALGEGIAPDSWGDGPFVVKSWGDTLVAGGAFDSAGTVAASRIAGWDGLRWFPLGAGVRGSPMEGDWVTGLAVSNGALIVGGAFATSGGIPVRNVARFTALGWDSLRSVAGFVTDAAVWRDSLFVSRYAWGPDAPALLLKWNGTAWAGVIGMTGGITSLSPGATRLLMTGPYAIDDDGVQGPRGFELAAWNGTGLESYESWTGRKNGIWWGENLWYPSTALAWHDGRLFAAFMEGGIVGEGTHYRGVGALASWDGVSWQEQPGLEGDVAQLGWDSDTLWAAGELRVASGDSTVQRSLLRRANGVWQPADTLSMDVTATLHERGHWYLAGRWSRYSYRSVTEVWDWNGTSWRRIGTLNTGDVSSMTMFGNRLVVGGAFTLIDGQPAASVAAWDGQQWAGLPPDTCERCYDQVHVVFSYGDLLLRSTAVANWAVERWTGARWEPLGELAGQATGFVVDQGRLLAYGSFFFESPLVLWDGAFWIPVNGAPINPGNVLGTTAGLWVSGAFYEAGHHGSFGIARWNGTIPSPPAPRGAISSAGDNPFAHSTVLRYTLSRPAHARILVYDVTGARRVCLLDRDLATGAGQVGWNADDAHGRRVAPGVYLACLELNGRRAGAVKLVRIP